MEELTEERKQKIIQALKERGVDRPCPRCGNANFTLVDGYFNQVLQTDLAQITLAGPTVPSIAVVCTRCGFISQHALGTLGLLPKGGEL